MVKEVKSNYAYIGDDENGKACYDYTKEMPILEFIQTVKIHGTNAGISYDGKDIAYQSRSNIISVENDNYGFARWCEERREKILAIMDEIYNLLEVDQVVLIGEFAGNGV